MTRGEVMALLAKVVSRMHMLNSIVSKSTIGNFQIQIESEHLSNMQPRRAIETEAEKTLYKSNARNFADTNASVQEPYMRSEAEMAKLLPAGEAAEGWYIVGGGQKMVPS